MSVSEFFTYEYYFKKFLYPFFNRLIGRNTFAVLSEREDSQYWSREKLQDLQLKKLKSVLVNAQEHVPFYREKFKEIGFDARTLASLEEFNRLNFFITKEDVRSQPEKFIADNCDRKKLNWHRTGGSTGTPLLFPTDPATDAASASAIIRSLHWWGIELGAKHAMFWGSPTFIVRTKLDYIKRLINMVRNSLMNRKFFLNYNLSEKNIPAIRESLENFKPKYVRGMPSSLYVFSKSLIEHGTELEKGKPIIVHSACEQLYDWQKSVIEKAFGCPVINTYGLSELADIAYEAPCGGLHTMDEDVLVELFPFQDDAKEIVATQLNNMMSPLIRYRTGDIAENLSSCDCGLALSVLTGLKGRAHDFIVAPDGKFLHGQFFTHLVVFEQGIQKYQVTQKERNYLHIKLVVGADYDASAEQRIFNGIRQYMGNEMRVDFSYVDHIPLTPSGKHRWIISEIKKVDEFI